MKEVIEAHLKEYGKKPELLVSAPGRFHLIGEHSWFCKDKTLSMAWTANSTKLPGGIWEGSGWTGQPLIVKWDDATKAIMNLYADKKTKADLVEVIYATLDGHIYFLDLEDGSRTRDPIKMGMCF